MRKLAWDFSCRSGCRKHGFLIIFLIRIGGLTTIWPSFHKILPFHTSFKKAAEAWFISSQFFRLMKWWSIQKLLPLICRHIFYYLSFDPYGMLLSRPPFRLIFSATLSKHLGSKFLLFQDSHLGGIAFLSAFYSGMVCFDWLDVLALFKVSCVIIHMYFSLCFIEVFESEKSGVSTLLTWRKDKGVFTILPEEGVKNSFGRGH